MGGMVYVLAGSYGTQTKRRINLNRRCLLLVTGALG
jgi:hypothetical protein